MVLDNLTQELRINEILDYGVYIGIGDYEDKIAVPVWNISNTSLHRQQKKEKYFLYCELYNQNVSKTILKTPTVQRVDSSLENLLPTS